MIARWGRIDVLVKSAGITGPQVPTADYALDAWDRVMAIMSIPGTLAIIGVGILAINGKPRPGQGGAARLATPAYGSSR